MRRPGDAGRGWDFFVSYTQADRAWAEWIAWVLEEDGYRVLIQAWDFVPGINWIRGMQDGIRDSSRTIAVLSDAYTKSVYSSVEWQAAWAADPSGTGRKLLVVRVAVCERPGLMAGIVGVDLFGVDNVTARGRLRDMIRNAEKGRAKPPVAPGFPGHRAVPTRPEFPGGPYARDPGPAAAAQARADRILADALRAARSINASWSVNHASARAVALARIAKTLGFIDTDRASNLIAEAERLTEAVSNKRSRAAALGEIAVALAVTDPVRAEHTAQSVPESCLKASALTRIAKASTITDPRRAARLIADAERYFTAFTGLRSYPEYLALATDLADAMAALEPDNAERVAYSISDTSYRAAALIRVARAAATDPDRAARLMADAEHLIASWPDPGMTPKNVLLTVVPDAVAGYRALGRYGCRRLLGVWLTTSDSMKASALAGIAEAAAATDPYRAGRLFADATHFAQSVTDPHSKDCALAHVSVALAATDPDRAEAIAESITSGYFKASSLAGIAEAVAATDPDLMPHPGNDR